MNTAENKKQISLDSLALTILQIQQDGDDGKFTYNVEQANSKFELVEEYKTLMDNMLEKHITGKVNFTSWESFKKDILSL